MGGLDGAGDEGGYIRGSSREGGVALRGDFGGEGGVENSGGGLVGHCAQLYLCGCYNSVEWEGIDRNWGNQRYSARDKIF